MKKLLAVALVLCLLVPCAIAESVDLSGLSFVELAALRDRCQKEMMKRDEWQKVTVPVGVWEIGKDIPAGHWNITASKNSEYGWGSLTYCDALDATGKNADRRKSSFYWFGQVKAPGAQAAVESENIDLDLKEGGYLIIEHAPMVFTPYTGKPDLGFK